MKEWCIVIQGPSVQVDALRKSVGEYNFIFSTWAGEEGQYNSSDSVIFNDKPSDPGIGNLFYQQITTINGFLEAKRLGFEKVLKLRSDFIMKDVKKLIDIFHKPINFFFWHNYCGGYLADYIMAGDIDLLIALWKENKNPSYKFAEQMILNNFLTMRLPSHQFDFFVKKINSNNDIFWTKYNKFLSSYKTDPLALDYIPEYEF